MSNILEWFTFKQKDDKNKVEKTTQMSDNKKIKDPKDQDSLVVRDVTDEFSWRELNYDIENRKQDDAKLLWLQYADNGIIDFCLDEILNEVIPMDEAKFNFILNKSLLEKNHKEIIPEIERSITKIVSYLGFEDNYILEDNFRAFMTIGQLFFENIYDKKDLKKGIISMKPLSPFGMLKIKDEKTGKYYYKYKNSDITSEEPRKRIQSMNSILIKKHKSFDANIFKEKKDVYLTEQISTCNTGKYSETLGTYKSYIHGAIADVNKLNLIEDSVVIYRLNKSGDKTIFNVYTGHLKPADQEKYVEKLKLKYNQRLYYDANKGELQNQKDTRILNENYWFPVDAQGNQTTMDTQQGNQFSVGELTDLMYFKDKIAEHFRVPHNRLRHNEEGGSEFSIFSANNIQMDKNDIRFRKASLRKFLMFQDLIIDAVKSDLVIQEIISPGDFDLLRPLIKFQHPTEDNFANSAEQTRMENNNNIAESFESAIEKGYISKQWVKDNVYKQSKEVQAQIKKEIEQEKKENPDEDY